MKLEDLKNQLASTEQELEAAKAHVHRCDGAVQVIRHFIKELEDSKGGSLPLDPSLPTPSTDSN